MTETEFLHCSDALFAHIQTVLDDADSEIDSTLNGNVLTLDLDNGSQVIVNRHLPNAEMWLAGRAGGYHFRQAADGRWVDTRDGGELFTRLAELLAAQGGESLVF